MHPRCRSTISAIVEGKTGSSIARNSKGENIKVPASMTYPDYKKVYLDKTMTLEQWQAGLINGVDNTIMNRRDSNSGVFKDLKITMQKQAVVKICRAYGVDISDLKIKIQRSEELLKYFYAGSADPKYIGRIDSFPNAFNDVEQLLRTVIHEGCHVKQFKKYGAAYVQENRLAMERVAERYENFFFSLITKRSGNRVK